eukprot:TRINITY_DN2720_c0_g1_i3.p1 TRINITY_DN2720_c0_g1~~TRINITY_DN2720_c0_g1_i3.p1  ORF type:complete len:145 (-),score=44.66 TRINITY_DN2720_c0_g1_i3:58-492(-)
MKFSLCIYHTGLDERGCSQVFGHVTALTHYIIPDTVESRFGFFAPGTVVFPYVCSVISALGVPPGAAADLGESVKAVCAHTPPRAFFVCLGCFAREEEARSFANLLHDYFANAATVRLLPFPNTFHQDLCHLGFVTHLASLCNF